MTLEAIQSVSIISYAGNNPEEDFWVYLWVKNGKSINISVPSVAGGFAAFIEKLGELPGWDNEKFVREIHAACGQHCTVWKTAIIPDARLAPLPDTPACRKLGEGIWLDDRSELIAWGSFGDLEKVPGIRKERYQPPNLNYLSSKYSLQNVTILNGLHLPELTVWGETVKRPGKPDSDWPVTRYCADFILAPSGVEGFQMLYDHFTKFLGKADHDIRPPGDIGDDASPPEQMSATWTRGRASLVIAIWKHSELQDLAPECHLRIDYDADTSVFFRSDYQQTLQISPDIAFACFPAKFRLPKEYVTTQDIWFTPPCFAEEFSQARPGLIWLDHNAGKLGIANEQLCRIVDAKLITSFLLTAHYWRDEPAGHTLSAVTRKGHRDLVSNFDLGGRAGEPEFTDSLKTITELETEIVEDRQYY